MKRLFLSIFIFLINYSAWAQVVDSKIITLKGINYGRNLIVQNPYNPTGVGYSVRKLTINGFVATVEINGSLFEIDFPSNFIKIGDSVTIKIWHHPGATPKIYNPESITDKDLPQLKSVGESENKYNYNLKDNSICLIKGILKTEQREGNRLYIDIVNKSDKNNYVGESSSPDSRGNFLVLVRFDDFFELVFMEIQTDKIKKKILIDLRGVPEDKRKGQVINIDLEIGDIEDKKREKLNEEFAVSKLYYNSGIQSLTWDEDYSKAINTAFTILNEQLSQEKSLKEIELDRKIKALALNKSKNDLIIKNLEIEKSKGDILTKGLEIEKQKSELEKQALDKKLKEKELKANATEISQQQKQKKYLYAILGFIALITFFSVFAYFKQKKLKRLISIEKEEADNQREIANQQKHLIEEKQKEILDSINYAKRLQQAILATPEEITKYLPNNFLLYLPKDIVAGDFYFFEVTDKFIFIAAADCTGHGVPGAMVSVVCSNALSRSVKEFALTEPGKILDKTRELVVETFKKSGQEVKDGMDISFIAIDRKNKELSWSGANNPLWIHQSGIINEIIANKQPIGYVENAINFTTHKLSVNEGDILYLFTDGYADQFGGPKGKKFKYSNLQKLLLDVSGKPMNQQTAKLQNEFDTWKGELEQVDDVCVIGIRIEFY